MSSVEEIAIYQKIHGEILANIIDEEELDLSNTAHGQIEAEIFNRFQLRMLKQFSDQMIAYKKVFPNDGIFQDNKDIFGKICEFMSLQSKRFSVDSKY